MNDKKLEAMARKLWRHICKDHGVKMSKEDSDDVIMDIYRMLSGLLDADATKSNITANPFIQVQRLKTLATRAPKMSRAKIIESINDLAQATKISASIMGDRRD